MRIYAVIWVLSGWLLVGNSVASELPRADGAVNESYAGFSVEYGSVSVDEGVRLRTVLTKPEGVAKPPLVLFVQWLSCGTVELPPDPKGGWSRMLKGIVTESGWAVMRSDKRGVGDSEGGDCTHLDYNTELADHRQILAAVKQRSDIDSRRIVIFGASMGSRMAPQLAANDPSVAGVLTWGGGSRSWYERMLAFDRHALELGGTPAAQIKDKLVAHARFHQRYLLDGIDPTALIAADSALQPVWEGIVGTSADAHYGRPFAFHQQAQRANWGQAWAQVQVPALIVMGEYDWFESAAGHLSSIRALNHGGRELGQFHLLPGIDHHFTRFDSAEAAFAEREGDGKADERAFLNLALPWLMARDSRSQ